jgi:hypothetical protein
MMESLTRSDDELISAYVTGELDEADRVRFELRLAAEPELAQRLLALEAIDLVGRTLQAQRAVRARHPLRRVWFAVAAAAAALAVVAWSWSASDPRIPCRVAAVASLGGGDLGSYAERLGVPPELRYSDTMRSGTTPTPKVSVATFLGEVGALESKRAERSLQSPAAPLGDDFFTLRLDVERQCHALVLQLHANGRWTRVFPSPSTPVFAETQNPLMPGLHTLPRPVVVPNAVGTVSLHPGFEVAATATVSTTWLVVGLHERAFEAATLANLDEHLRTHATTAADPAPPDDPASWVQQRSLAVLEWCSARGITTRQLAVAAH